MSPISIKTKLVSLFVLTFLCLNAGGAFCLAYCQSTSAHTADSNDHCPLSKGSSDCHHATQQSQSKEDASSVESGAVTCCSLAINMFSAPIERKQESVQVADIPERPKAVEITSTFAARPFNFPPTGFVAPSVDRRDERVKHCLFRI
jgi:hypothetical protein